MCSAKLVNPFEHTKAVTKLGIDAAKKGTDLAVNVAKKTTPTTLGGSAPDPLAKGLRNA